MYQVPLVTCILLLLPNHHLIWLCRITCPGMAVGFMRLCVSGGLFAKASTWSPTFGVLLFPFLAHFLSKWPWVTVGFSRDRFSTLWWVTPKSIETSCIISCVKPQYFCSAFRSGFHSWPFKQPYWLLVPARIWATLFILGFLPVSVLLTSEKWQKWGDN